MLSTSSCRTKIGTVAGPRTRILGASVGEITTLLVMVVMALYRYIVTLRRTLQSMHMHIYHPSLGIESGFVEGLVRYDGTE